MRRINLCDAFLTLLRMRDANCARSSIRAIDEARPFFRGKQNVEILSSLRELALPFARLREDTTRSKLLRGTYMVAPVTSTSIQIFACLSLGNKDLSHSELVCIGYVCRFAKGRSQPLSWWVTSVLEIVVVAFIVNLHTLPGPQVG